MVVVIIGLAVFFWPVTRQAASILYLDKVDHVILVIDRGGGVYERCGMGEMSYWWFRWLGSSKKVLELG